MKPKVQTERHMHSLFFSYCTWYYCIAVTPTPIKSRAYAYRSQKSAQKSHQIDIRQVRMGRFVGWKKLHPPQKKTRCQHCSLALPTNQQLLRNEERPKLCNELRLPDNGCVTLADRDVVGGPLHIHTPDGESCWNETQQSEKRSLQLPPKRLASDEHFFFSFKKLCSALFRQQSKW